MATHANDALSCESKEIVEGLHAHFISQRWLAHEESARGLGHLSVAVAIGFGSANFACVLEPNHPCQLAPGLAHLLEHIVLDLHHEGLSRNLSGYYGATVGGTVTEDRIIFYVTNAMTHRGEQNDFAYWIVRMLLQIVCDRVDAETFSNAESNSRRVINSELLGKVNEPLELLLYGLFHSGNLQTPASGTTDSVKMVLSQHAAIAHEACRRALRTIVVQTGEFEPGTVSAVQKAIRDVAPSSLGRIRLHGPSEPAAAHLASVGLKPKTATDDLVSYIGYGLKMPPFRQLSLSRDALASRIAFSFAAKKFLPSPFIGVCSEFARAYSTKYVGPENNRLFFLYADDINRVKRMCRQGIFNAIERFQDAMPNQVEFYWRKLAFAWWDLVELCVVSDMYGFTFSELFESIKNLTESVADDVLTEIKNASPEQETLVYISRFADVLS